MSSPLTKAGWFVFCPPGSTNALTSYDDFGPAMLREPGDARGRRGRVI
jgi:hypothetical protein